MIVSPPTLRPASCHLIGFPPLQLSQGDLGEKGPEGAPGKDGGRVSGSHFIFSFTLIAAEEKGFLYSQG